MPRDDPRNPDLRPDEPEVRDPELDDEVETGDPDDDLTARPTPGPPRRFDDEDDRLVPSTNIGGAAPTPLGADSGGDLPGPEDDLANLAEPEPPPAPEVEGLSVRPERDIIPTMGKTDPEP